MGGLGLGGGAGGLGSDANIAVPTSPSVPVKVANKPLYVVLRELGEAAKFPVNIGVSLPEAKTPITADLGELPLDEAVAILADMAGLQMVKHDNFLYVTTAKGAARLRAVPK